MKGKFKKQLCAWRQKFKKIKKMLLLGECWDSYFKKMIRMILR
jgi:hypothetical protein